MSAGERPSEAADSGCGPLDGASNVLVLSPSMSDRARGAYFETFFPTGPAALDVLAVDYRRTPDQWIEEWKRHLGDRPRSCVVVSIDETTRSAAASTVGAGNVGEAAVGVENPGDLTGLGITVSEYLSDHPGPGTVVTFDSLTVLLQYVDLQRAFRFLHVLSNRVRVADAVAHYHMDPGAHDDREIATLASLFDVVAEFDDGEWSVNERWRGEGS